MNTSSNAKSLVKKYNKKKKKEKEITQKSPGSKMTNSV